MGGGASKEKLAAAEQKLAAALQKLADEVAAKNNATKRANDATQRAEYEKKAKEEAEQKFADERQAIDADKDKSAADARKAEEARNTELALEKAHAENKLQEIAERQNKEAQEQLRVLKNKETNAFEEEAVSQEALDKWKRSLEELGGGDDERFTRQIFDEMVPNAAGRVTIDEFFVGLEKSKNDHLPAIDEKKKRDEMMAMVRKANSNIRRYRVDAEWGYEGIYGDHDDFQGGLHKFAGKPLVAGEEKLEAEMKREFLECCDESVSRIQTTNYGRFKTDLKTEWEFVVNPIEDRVYPGQEGHTGTDPETNKPYQGREIIQLEKFIHHPMAKKAKLNRVEVMGLRFYTGPVFMAINNALRKKRFKNKKGACFTVTIAVINSAVIKLAYVTNLAVIRLLYRGINGMSLPDVLLRLEGNSSIVEFAFCSATPEKHVALSYAGAGECKGPGNCSESCEDRKASGTRPPPIGLKWENTGDTKPTHGRELINPNLSKALTNQIKFTLQELDNLGIHDLHCDDFIKVDGSCFIPAAPRSLQSPYVIVWYVSGWDSAQGLLLKTPDYAVFDEKIAYVKKLPEVEELHATSCRRGEYVCRSEKAWKVCFFDPEGQIMKSASSSPDSEPVAPSSGVLDSDWARAPFICQGPSCGYFDDSVEFDLLSDESKNILDPRTDSLNPLSRDDSHPTQFSSKDRTMGIVRCQKCKREQTLSVVDFKTNSWRVANIPPATSYKTLNSGPCDKHIHEACSGWNFEEGFCNEHRSTLMEIKTGAVDRGASLKWCSQFPTENEHILLPLSNFEITGTRRDQLPTGGFINVLEMKLNINLNAQTLEDLEGSRKNSCIEFGEEILSEIESSIAESQVYGQPQHLEDIQRFRHKILSKVESQTSQYFNNPARFHDAIEEMFKGRSMIMQEIEETIYDYCKSRFGVLHEVDTARDFSFADKLGHVNLKEFSAMYSNEDISRSQMEVMFNSLNINQDGGLCREEFSKIVGLREEKLTQEINMCVRLLSQNMANGSGDKNSGTMLSNLLLHTNKKDLGGLKALFAQHELNDCVDAKGNPVNVCESVCNELKVKAVEDLSMVELKSNDVTFLQPIQRGKLLRLIAEVQSKSEEQAQFMTTKGDALWECHLNRSLYDSKFVLLQRALDAYQDAVKIRKRQAQGNDEILANRAVIPVVNEIWTPQIAALQNKIGYLTQQSGKRYDGSFDAGKLSKAMSIFQSSLKLTDEVKDALAEKFAQFDMDHSGYIDFEEFSTLDTNHGLSESKLHMMFDSLDVNHTGKLSRDEFGHVHFVDTEQTHSPRKRELFVQKSPRRASVAKTKTMSDDYSLNTSRVSFSIDRDDESPDLDPCRIKFDKFVHVKMDTLEYINSQLWKLEKREAAEMWDKFCHILIMRVEYGADESKISAVSDILAQIYRGTHDQKGLSSGKQHDAALKVVRILGKNDNAFSMKEVSKVMYNNLPISNVQLWGCIALEAIMVRIHEKDRLRHFLAQELHEIFSSADTDKSRCLSYEEWEQAFGGEGVDKVMLRQLFDEMDANQKNMVSLRELEQGLFGAKIRKTAAEEQRISIEFAMDKVLISLHNYAGNQGISQHACSLILEFVKPFKHVDISNAPRPKTPRLPLESLFSSLRQQRSIGSVQVNHHHQEEALALQRLSATLNTELHEDTAKGKAPVGTALLKRAISQVMLALELHPQNTQIRAHGNAFIDLVYSFEDEGMDDVFFQQLDQKRKRVNKTANTERKQVDVCKTCALLQSPCKDCFFTWFMGRHEEIMEFHLWKEEAKGESTAGLEMDQQLEVTLLQDEVAAGKKETAELKAQIARLHATCEEERTKMEQSLASPRGGRQTTNSTLTDVIEQHRQSERLATLANEKTKAELEQMKKDFAHLLQKKERSHQTELAKIKRGTHNLCSAREFSFLLDCWYVLTCYTFGYTEAAEESDNGQSQQRMLLTRLQTQTWQAGRRKEEDI